LNFGGVATSWRKCLKDLLLFFSWNGGATLVVMGNPSPRSGLISSPFVGLGKCVLLTNPNNLITRCPQKLASLDVMHTFYHIRWGNTWFKIGWLINFEWCTYLSYKQNHPPNSPTAFKLVFQMLYSLRKASDALAILKQLLLAGFEGCWKTRVAFQVLEPDHAWMNFRVWKQKRILQSLGFQTPWGWRHLAPQKHTIQTPNLRRYDWKARKYYPKTCARV